MSKPYFEEIQSEILDEFTSYATFNTTGFVRFQPGGTIMNRGFGSFVERFPNFEVRSDDVWIASYPKSGTTWTQEMVWNILHDVDLERAKNTNMDIRVPFIEVSHLLKEFSEKWIKPPMTPLPDTLTLVETMPKEERRTIKTHLPVQMMPEQVLTESKIVYVSRNPRDVVLSGYNHWRILEKFQGDFPFFFKAFTNDVAGYYNPMIQHNIDWWNLSKKQENILFIRYEDMKQDLNREIRKVSKFLEKDLSDEQIEKLNQHLQFDSMKNNTAVNKANHVEHVEKCSGMKEPDAKFMRKGISGDWRQKLTPDQINIMEEWEADRLKDTDFRFTYQ